MTQADRPDGMRAAVHETYGPADLSAVPVFAGGFINFGYWQPEDLDRPPTVEDRIRSQQDLYRQVLDSAGPLGGARLLEVGCGLGVGCALALAEYGPAQVTGMDIHPQQLDRARRANADLLDVGGVERLRLARGAAERMPFGDAEFDCVYSVEAAQHFDDLALFAAETARVLRPGGRTAITSFFTPDPAGAPRLAELLDTFADGLDIARTPSELTDALAWSGMVDVRCESIGPSVWPGWDHWLSAQWKPGTWPRNFLHAWEKGFLDYYVITASRP
ncbi:MULTISPECIES: methyltransferase domain-containing protein [unclassified Streptomyces]|uniref:class I SAM-dependent methyltransferase n=1 Tax=unclassified Streptomyces TaxID=2593676 RepID=UPI002E36A498|nr:methyltransferase domain-containing protein [Streptomyces sp. NBC_01268]